MEASGCARAVMRGSALFDTKTDFVTATRQLIRHKPIRCEQRGRSLRVSPELRKSEALSLAYRLVEAAQKITDGAILTKRELLAALGDVPDDTNIYMETTDGFSPIVAITVDGGI